MFSSNTCIILHADTIDVDTMHCDIPSSPTEDDTSDATLATMLAVKEIAINRNNVLKDMIREFQDDDVLVNSLEVVFFDFRHDYQKEEWQSVARILVVGFQKHL